MSLLLCFSGQIGSGKSSVSAEVASVLGWARVGFGEYLRSEIQRLGGDSGAREALQKLGQKRVESDATKFCQDVLDAGGFVPGDDFVVDGIRHVRIFDILTSIGAPSQAKLLYLHAQETTRLSRIGARDDVQDFARASVHDVEAELRDELPERADGIVNAGNSFEQVVGDCLRLVENWRRELPDSRR
ncbi:hypothetical protein [Nitratireductor thuwali]|uniref:Cytidylate kinase n=1 Tax=Nitratireductor thuwali TaxID=2267699 RepID=A0ABY5MKT0_9HYPH|nr:Cytidylate kinase [Nitratireductor thuwali]